MRGREEKRRVDQEHKHAKPKRWTSRERPSLRHWGNSLKRPRDVCTHCFPAIANKHRQKNEKRDLLYWMNGEP